MSVPWRLGNKAAAACSWVFSPPRTTREQALERMERLGAWTHLMSSLEHLASPAERAPGGMNNWEVSRASLRIENRQVRRLLDVVGRTDVTCAVHSVRVAAALLLVVPSRRRGARCAADTVLACTSLLLHPRHHYGTDGSDQVGFLVLWAAALARASQRRPAVVDAALWTVAASATMSYAVSGWAKLAGPTWRQGRALEGVTRTLTYGDRRTYELLSRHRRAARVLGASVLALECSFPLAYLGGGRLARPYVGAAAAMHLSIARIMALGRFVPAFTSMHPAVLYTARDRVTTAAGPGPVRDDAVPRLLAVGAVAAAATFAVARQVNASRVAAGRGDEHFLHTVAGSSLSLRTWEHRGPGSPVFVLEHGLLSTQEHWEWVAEGLSDCGTVVTYSRAGYGRSQCPPGGAVTFDDLVADAVQLVEEVARGRPVVLVGHSLGGWLVHRCARQARVDLRAVILVDSSHPDELRRSMRQAHGAEGLTAVLPAMARSLDLGLGVLLDVPAWVRSLPVAAQPTALAQYRDSRMWRAARREWAATLREFEARPPVPPIAAPVVAVVAQRSAERDPEHAEMQHELAATGSSSSVQVVEGADHDTLLTLEAHARHVVSAIRAAGILDGARRAEAMSS